jgi:hypothetical protein
MDLSMHSLQKRCKHSITVLVFRMMPTHIIKPIISWYTIWSFWKKIKIIMMQHLAYLVKWHKKFIRAHTFIYIYVCVLQMGTMSYFKSWFPSTTSIKNKSIARYAAGVCLITTLLCFMLAQLQGQHYCYATLSLPRSACTAHPFILLSSFHHHSPVTNF